MVTMNEAVNNLDLLVQEETGVRFSPFVRKGPAVYLGQDVQFKLVNQGPYYFSVTCRHDEQTEPWCEHMQLAFNKGYERYLLAGRVGTSFQLNIPIYPSARVGMTLDFTWEEPLGQWIVLLALDGPSGNKVYDIGTFGYTATRPMFVAAFENAWDYIVDVNEDLFTSCTKCDVSIDTQFAAGSVILGMTSLCYHHHMERLKFDDAVPDVDGSASKANTTSFNSVDDVPVGHGSMDGEGAGASGVGRVGYVNPSYTNQSLTGDAAIRGSLDHWRSSRRGS